jgi:hypothetical protein
MKNLFIDVGDMLMIIRQYIKEFRYLKTYILSVAVLTVLFWSFHFLMNKDIMIKLGKEDGLFEWLTAICFLTVSILFFHLFQKGKYIFYLLLSIIFLIGFGEEISWGYRIFHFDLPDSLQKTNVSQEFNVHNIEIFNTMDLQKQNKHGLERILEIEFLFKIFTLAYCVLLPFLVYQVSFIGRFTVRLKLPVPPISIGLFFIVNYLTYKISNFVLVNGADRFNDGYIYSFVETFECVESIIFLAIAIYFYNKRDIIIPGEDIKQLVHYQALGRINQEVVT